LKSVLKIITINNSTHLLVIIKIVKKLFITAIVLLIFLYPGISGINKSYASGSLVGYWKLDETTQGSNAVDSSGTNTGIPQGTGSGPNPSTDVPSSITFSDPRSASFNGTDQYFNCGDTPSNLPTGSSERSITAWIKGNSFVDSDGKSIAGWGRDSAGELSELRINVSNQVEFHGNNNDIAGSTSLSTGQWYFVATTITSGGAITIYVNGTQDGTGSVSLNTQGTNCKIGRQPDFDGQYFNGLIDDVRFYNTALTSTQISNLAAGSQDPDLTPTPTPTPTSAPSSNSQTSSSSGSSAPSCTNAVPTNTPDLFQIDSAQTQATLYFTPINNADRYFISYGTGENINQYGIEVINGDSSGVLSYTINSLNPHTKYSFVIRGGNGCMPGNWGNTMQIETQKSTSTKELFYKNFLARVLSIIPKQVTKVSNTLALSSQTGRQTCQTYTVQPGDSYWSIAARLLGNGNIFRSIMDKNNATSTIINPGQKLKVGC
jgi:LysM repeat protein